MKVVIALILVSLFPLTVRAAGKGRASASVDAAGSAGLINQVFRGQKQAVASLPNLSETLKPGDVLVITSLAGEACVAPIIEVSDLKNYLLDISQCTAADSIIAGARVSRPEFRSVTLPAGIGLVAPGAAPAVVVSPPTGSASAAPVSVPPVAAQATELDERRQSSPVHTPTLEYERGESSKWRGHFGLTYNTAGTLSFQDSQFRSGNNSFTGKYDLELEGAPAFTVGATYSPKQSWGMNVGVSTEAKRRIKSQKITVDGSDAVAEDHEEHYNLRFTHVYLNAIYRWENFYLPFGLNYSIVQADKELTQFKHIQGSAGVQFGVGVFANDSVAFEFLIQATSVRTGGAADGTSYYELGSGAFAAGSLAVKIFP